MYFCGMQKVLLTGITGFLGSHTAIQLLNKGYQVVGTMRDLKRAESIRKVIAQHTDKVQNLTFAQASLEQQEVWNDLMKGVDYVQHIASPFLEKLPKDENELILPARNGTLHVLWAAAAHGVKRVVLTSSSGAIVYGKDKDKRSGLYTEKDWTTIENKQDTTPYFRSKAIAERAAWDFIAQDKSGLELVTICPCAILGPVLEKDYSPSVNMVIKTMDGSSPALPDIGFDSIDVRSVADMHVRAMEVPEAKGERFICSAGFLSFKEIAHTLREAYPKKRIPTMVLPHFAIRLFSYIEPTLKPILIDLGVERCLDHTKAEKILGWKPINNKEAILSCAESLIRLGVLKV
jgi:dihydroflavonol-4-reductase